MRSSPNVILMVIDTLRADHLSCYGYNKKTSPNIDKIAEGGILYKNAFSAAPWTPPSHASIFTGKYPSYHKTMGKNVYFGKQNVSLAEILSRNKYECFGVVGCGLLGSWSGFDRGFKEYYEIKRNRLIDLGLAKLQLKDVVRSLIYGPDKNARIITEMLKALITKNRFSKNPFFLFINYFDCHTPYDPPRPFKERFCANFSESKLYLQELLLNKIFDKTTQKIADSELDIYKLVSIASGHIAFRFVTGNLQISEREWEVVKSWYDGEIAYVDHCIGEFVRFLDNEDLFDNTVLIITSDHGESFGEHGLAIHPLCLYDNVIHVPLILSCPALIPRNKKFSNLVSTIDIFPTLVDLLKISAPLNGIQGKSLLPFQERKIHDFICAEYGGLHTEGMRVFRKVHGMHMHTISGLSRIDVGRKCVRNLTYKYIFSPQNEELYNIRDDPLEQVNILSKGSNQAKLLRKQLENNVDITYFGPREYAIGKQAQQLLNRLRSLGYV